MPAPRAKSDLDAFIEHYSICPTVRAIHIVLPSVNAYEGLFRAQYASVHHKRHHDEAVSSQSPETVRSHSDIIDLNVINRELVKRMFTFTKTHAEVLFERSVHDNRFLSVMMNRTNIPSEGQRLITSKCITLRCSVCCLHVHYLRIF